MPLKKEAEKRERQVMQDNSSLIKNGKCLSAGDIGKILHSSFWNHLLRFIIIDGRKYPTNSKIHLKGKIFLDYTNPHVENVRISYDEKKKVLFMETMTWVPHPFIAMQRIDLDASVKIMFTGYEAAGYTDPDEKVQEWKKVGEEIPIDKIRSIRIKSFWDRPKAVWSNREDYTAFEIRIKTCGKKKIRKGRERSCIM